MYCFLLKNYQKNNYVHEHPFKNQIFAKTTIPLSFPIIDINIQTKQLSEKEAWKTHNNIDIFCPKYCKTLKVGSLNLQKNHEKPGRGLKRPYFSSQCPRIAPGTCRTPKCAARPRGPYLRKNR